MAAIGFGVSSTLEENNKRESIATTPVTESFVASVNIRANISNPNPKFCEILGSDQGI